MRRNDIVTEARKWLDVKWQHQGRSKSGVDCAGLCVVTARGLGLEVQDTTNYQRRTHGTEFLEYFRSNLVERPYVEMQCGDVIVLTEPSYPCHCGIVTERHGELYFIHAYAKRRKVVEERISEDWRKRIVGVFSFPAVED